VQLLDPATLGPGNSDDDADARRGKGYNRHVTHATVATSVEDTITSLRSRGLRITPQRRAILQEILNAKGHISPPSVARAVQARMPGVNASTVYRTLTMLEDLGFVSHSHHETGAEYHRAGEGDHVHLICASCGTQDDLSSEEERALARLIGRHGGFRPDLTHFAISGTCARCQERGARRAQ
jgi:Fur family transcriptional regulator, ferric uptake regulator